MTRVDLLLAIESNSWEKLEGKIKDTMSQAGDSNFPNTDV